MSFGGLVVLVSSFEYLSLRVSLLISYHQDCKLAIVYSSSATAKIPLYIVVPLHTISDCKQSFKIIMLVL